MLFLVAAGLQLVFGVQKIVNLACGSFYALGAYFGITFGRLWRIKLGLPPWLLLPVCIVAGLADGGHRAADRACAAHGLRRDESFQLLLTFALVLMFQDVFRFIWGANPRSLDNVYLDLRHDHLRRFQRSGLQSAGDRGGHRHRSRARRCSCSAQTTGASLRATAENRDMAEALGVNVRRDLCGRVHPRHVLGTVGGALVVPSAAASLDMAIEFVVEAFAVVVIGGLGSHARRAGRRAGRRADPRAISLVLS